MISSLENNFPDHVIGYSDHTLPSKDMNNITTLLTGCKSN